MVIKTCGSQSPAKSANLERRAEAPSRRKFTGPRRTRTNNHAAAIDSRNTGSIHACEADPQRFAVRQDPNRYRPRNPAQQLPKDRTPIRCPSRHEHFLTAIDVGSAKTCVLVAEITENGLRYRGHGLAESRGSRKGIIVDLEKAVASIQKAVERAEDSREYPDRACDSRRCRRRMCVESTLMADWSSAARERLAAKKFARPLRKPATFLLPPDREVLHLLPQEFILDEQSGVHDPLGMIATRLEVRVHMITAATSATQNVVTAVNRAGVHVDDTVFEPLACADSVLRSDERELGICLADIGAGSTNVLVIQEGAVAHSAVLPVGGDHFTSDLSVGLCTPIVEAEKIKKAFRQYRCHADP